MRRVALFVALALLTAACKGESNAPPIRRATTTSSSSTTTSTAVTSPATTAGASATPPAPGGCDPATLSRGDPRPDRTRYRVQATLDLEGNRVFGALQAVFTPDKSTDQIIVRMWPNGPNQKLRGASLSISNATFNEKPVTIVANNPTTASLDTGDIAAGQSVGITLLFSLTLPGAVDDRLARIGTTVRLGSWLPLLSWEPSHAWTLDPPTTSDAEASTSIAADFDVRFDAPAGLTVLGTGAEISPGRWRAIAVPDWGASVGDFRIARGEASGVPVIVGVDATISESPTTYLNRVIGSMQALAARYGPYPYPNYSLAITPALRGGIEYPGHVMQGPNSNARTTPHEVAHMWFYSLVGSNQGRDPWLDEGLASWAEAVINGSYRSFVTRSIPSDGRNRIGQPMTYWDQHESSYYRSVYVQTVQALNALGVPIATIDCALARYVAANAYRVATPVDLLRALKTVAPNAREVLLRYGAQRI